MGARGPVPKPIGQRHGHISKEQRAGVTQEQTPPAAAAFVAPPPDDGWHPVARDWYLSLAESGQATFYQPSDWQTARVWAEVLSRQLAGDKMSAVMIQAWSGSATELLTTEGSRRRARLELERVANVDEDEAAAVIQLAAYREQVGG